MQLFADCISRHSRGFQAVVRLADEELVAGYGWGEAWNGAVRTGVPTVHVDGEDVEKVLARCRTPTSVLMAGSLQLTGSWASVAESANDVSSVLGLRGAPIAGHGDHRPLVAVLAGPNDEQGVLGPVAADRALAGLRLVRADPRARLVLTGGYGPQFNTTAKPHWWHSAEMLSAHGLGLARVAGCVESRHTYEDLLFVRVLAARERSTSVTVVTSAHHVARVKFIASLLFPAIEVRRVQHADLSEDRLRPLVRHETVALGRTVAAAPYSVWRLGSAAAERC